MLVALLQMMGLPMGNPVHSRAEGRSEPPTSRAGKPDTPHPAHRVSVRRQEVKANKASPSKAKVAPAAVKTAKPVAKVAAAAKTKAVPVAAAQKSSTPKKAVAVKSAAKAAPAKKTVAPVKSNAKTKPAVAAKTVTPAKASPKVKPTVAPKAAAPAKPSAKVKPAVAPKVTAAPKPVATPAKKSVPAPAKKTVAAPAQQKTPTKLTQAKASVVVAEPKVAPPVNAIAPKPAAPVPAPAVVNPVPTKSGRPSSRLAQLTVPSMAQSVASTAAKASFNPSSHEPFSAPVIPAIVKKDSKLANNWKTTPVERLTDAELLAMPDSEYMNDVQLAAFKLKLNALKRDILSNAGETTEHLREDTSVVPDPADRATIEEEHALELRTRDRERKLLKKIEQSIARIDAGDYGYCDETGEAIGVGRLLARPTATLSLEAQQRRELKQKMFGD